MLDEPSSALDARSEALIQRTLDRLDCSLLIVAHRLATIKARATASALCGVGSRGGDSRGTCREGRRLRGHGRAPGEEKRGLGVVVARLAVPGPCLPSSAGFSTSLRLALSAVACAAGGAHHNIYIDSQAVQACASKLSRNSFIE